MILTWHYIPSASKFLNFNDFDQTLWTSRVQIPAFQWFWPDIKNHQWFWPDLTNHQGPWLSIILMTLRTIRVQLLGKFQWFWRGHVCISCCYCQYYRVRINNILHTHLNNLIFNILRLISYRNFCQPRKVNQGQIYNFCWKYFKIYWFRTNSLKYKKTTVYYFVFTNNFYIFLFMSLIKHKSIYMQKKISIHTTIGMSLLHLDNCINSKVFN